MRRKQLGISVSSEFSVAMIRTVVCALVFAVAATGQNLEFPVEFLQDMVNMLLGSLDVIVSGCESTINVNDVEYIFYNKQNSIKPIKLNSINVKQISPKLPTKIILHGWFGTAMGPTEIKVKDAYLRRGDYNIIFVNWERHATVNYVQAHCNLGFLGDIIGNFIYDLYKMGKIELNMVHLIGHSLGAHLAGYVGQHIRQRTGGQKIFRITGLDAAGPGFLGFPEDKRLDANDAHFVDAIHTNGAQFGYSQSYGSVDFYPNCGLFQPGCFDLDPNDNARILQQTMENIVCSHNRSVQYFIESINSNKFIATRYNSCYLLTKCSKGSKKTRIVMGEDCPATATGSYCLNTNSKPPYAIGI